MIIKYKNNYLDFKEVKLSFNDGAYVNVFGNKNNKTLLETINSEKYKKLKSKVINKYLKFLDWPLGEFLLKLKNEQDNFYLYFLNKHGDKTYCHFEMCIFSAI